MTDVRRQIAERVAGHLLPMEVVALGIGIPTLVADYIDPSGDVHLESENGVLGVGAAPPAGQEDPSLINASKLPITVLPGAAYFSSSESFALIRGGHVTTAVLGALQIDSTGRIANWSVPGRSVLGVGGAMDLLVGARRVIAAMRHADRGGRPKIVEECTYPLSGDRPVDLIVTERATFMVEDGGLVLVEVAPGRSLQWVEEHTAAPFSVSVNR